MHKALADQLDNYIAYTQQEKDELNLTKQFLKNAPHPFDRSNLEGHFTASAWVVNHDRSQTLLLNHRKLKIWVQPGGHADGNPDLIEVASKELEEETGIFDYKLITPTIFHLAVYDIPEFQDIPRHNHYDLMYAFEVSDESDLIEAERESDGIKWFEVKNLYKLGGAKDYTLLTEKTQVLLAK